TISVAGQQSSATACGGFCPPGLVCTQPPGLAGCICKKQPVACGQASAPSCSGTCPPDFSCITFHNHCLCVGCINTDPGTTDGTGFTSKTSMTWDQEACSTSYNV